MPKFAIIIVILAVGYFLGIKFPQIGAKIGVM